LGELASPFPSSPVHSGSLPKNKQDVVRVGDARVALTARTVPFLASSLSAQERSTYFGGEVPFVKEDVSASVAGGWSQSATDAIGPRAAAGCFGTATA